MIDWSKVIEKINYVMGTDEQYHACHSVSGGDINSAYQLLTKSNTQYFVKLNDFNLINMFMAEFEALNELQKCDCLRSPHPICYGQLANNSFIVMQYLSLQQQGDDYGFGKNLAKMHKISHSNFGWKYNNTIGSTPQSNQQYDNWPQFWTTQRLVPQLTLLDKKLDKIHYQKGIQDLLKKRTEVLLSGIDDFFQGHKPNASLLHGDLWSGNYAFDNNGHGVIFDPALYYGDRETDLAMTELFGGFSSDFYKGYEEEFPLADGYKKRKPMYNLYHIINHANLFGGSYIQQSLNTMELILQKSY